MVGKLLMINPQQNTYYSRIAGFGLSEFCNSSTFLPARQVMSKISNGVSGQPASFSMCVGSAGRGADIVPTCCESPVSAPLPWRSPAERGCCFPGEYADGGRPQNLPGLCTKSGS